MVLSSLESCQPTEYFHASGYGNYTGSCCEIAPAIYIHPHYIHMVGSNHKPNYPDTNNGTNHARKTIYSTF